MTSKIIWLLLLFFITLAHHQTYGNQPQDSVIQVAVLSYQDVDIHSFAGATDVFIKAAQVSNGRCNIFTLAITDLGVRSEAGFMNVTPTFSAWSDPEIDILIVPGGTPAAIDSLTGTPVFSRVLDGMMRKAKYTLGLGNGCILIAATGRLNGYRATANPKLAADFERKFPQVEYLPDVRFVESRNIVTSSGIVAGIDAAFLLLEKLIGVKVVRQVSELMDFPY